MTTEFEKELRPVRLSGVFVHCNYEHGNERGNEMSVREPGPKRNWHPVVTGLLSLAALGINLWMFSILIAPFEKIDLTGTNLPDIRYTELQPAATALFLMLLMIHLLQCFWVFRESRIICIKHLIYVLALGWAVLMIYQRGQDAGTWFFVCNLYLAACLAGCLLSMIRKRSKWNIVLFIVTLLVMLIGLCLQAYSDLGVTVEDGGVPAPLVSLSMILILFMMIDVQGIAAIIPVAFSSIRMDILKKIIRKTYAAEILFGIVLLIVAFSLILPAFEENIPTFGDALWYCFAIVTTIGFGDITAVSVVGRILSVILGIYGIIVVSLITSIIVNFYGEMKREEGDDENTHTEGAGAEAAADTETEPAGRNTGGRLEEIEL